jgi:hypothetical protein
LYEQGDNDFYGVLEKIGRDIEKHGWSAISVFATEDNPGVGFTYTVGLRDSYDHPELIVYTLNALQAHGVLFSAIKNIKEGKGYEKGERRTDVIEGPNGTELPVVIHEVPEPGEPLTAARRFHNRDESALQIVWPDPNNRFPGEPGYDAENFPQPLATGTTD